MEGNKKREHIFAICAYKESPYLEECILSLEKQTRKSSIIMVTSTPNKYIEELSRKYEIPLFINHGEHGITQDWNFAYQCANARYVTMLIRRCLSSGLLAEELRISQTGRKGR